MQSELALDGLLRCSICTLPQSHIGRVDREDIKKDEDEDYHAHDDEQSAEYTLQYKFE
jgi:hypothetical protein